MNNRTNPTSIWAALAEPFQPHEVDVKVQSVSKDRTKGRVVAYIDARAAMNRLDRVVGVDGWSDTYQVLEAGTVKCRLTVLGVSKEDTGIGEDLKAAFSDALKRAAVKFGVGRYLYDLPTVWAPLDERGRMVDASEVKGRMLGYRPPIPRYVGPNGG